jgi:hypothetical protein
MNILQIASLSESGKVGYNTANESFFIPERLREDIKPLSYALVVDQKINLVYKNAAGDYTDANGNVLDADADPIQTGETDIRKTISFVGSFADCVKAKNQPAILAKAESKLIDKLADDAMAEFGLTAEQMEATI